MKKCSSMCAMLLLIAIFFLLFFCRNSISNFLWKTIDNRMDYERSLEVGEEFNKIMWGDCTFQINHYKTGNNLEYVKDEEITVLLKSIYSYKISNGNFYVISKNGYGVIDSNNCATLFIKFGNITNNKKIKYIRSFEEFEENDKAEFERMR